jgi:hypothetical protein
MEKRVFLAEASTPAYLLKMGQREQKPLCPMFYKNKIMLIWVKGRSDRFCHPAEIYPEKYFFVNILRSQSPLYRDKSC